MARWKIPNMLKHNFIRHFLYKASHALQNHITHSKASKRDQSKEKER